MKTRILDRILLAIILIVIIAVSLGAATLSLGLISIDMVQSCLVGLYASMTARLVIGIVALVLILFALLLAFRKPQKPQATAMITKTDTGASYIAISALNSMAHKHCCQNHSVRECIVKVNAESDGIAIEAQLSLVADTNIPSVIAELRQTLKEYMESMSGIPVKNIRFLIIDHAETETK